MQTTSDDLVGNV